MGLNKGWWHLILFIFFFFFRGGGGGGLRGEGAWAQEPPTPPPPPIGMPLLTDNNTPNLDSTFMAVWSTHPNYVNLHILSLTMELYFNIILRCYNIV